MLVGSMVDLRDESKYRLKNGSLDENRRRNESNNDGRDETCRDLTIKISCQSFHKTWSVEYA